MPYGGHFQNGGHIKFEKIRKKIQKNSEKILKKNSYSISESWFAIKV